MSRRILVLKDQRNSCAEPLCAQLQSTLYGLFPGSTIGVRNLDSNLHREAEGFPGMVFLRSSDPAEMNLHVQRLRTEFPRTPFMGILCHIGEEHEIPPTLIEQLDDHLCSPFPQLVLPLRLHPSMAAPRISAP